LGSSEGLTQTRLLPETSRPRTARRLFCFRLPIPSLRRKPARGSRAADFVSRGFLPRREEEMWIEWLERTLSTRDAALYDAMRARRDDRTAVAEDGDDAEHPTPPTRLSREKCLAAVPMGE
jgi:hypothetical protein